MQVVMCEAYGGPDGLVVRSVASPSPGPGEVKIRLRASGVSFSDVLRIAGQYHVKTEPPFIPGGEAAGQIVQLGVGAKGVQVGDRVLCGGGFAEQTVQPASSPTLSASKRLSAGEDALAKLHDANPASLAQGNRLVTKVDRGVELIEAFSVVPILAPVS